MSSDKPLLDSYVRLIEKVGGVRTNLRRLFRPLYRRQEVRRAEEQVPGMREVASRLEASKSALSEEYARYTSTVSDNVFALSLDVSAFIDAYCRVRAPKRVLDLGSGFSSFVLRSHQKRSSESVQVKSVDDSAEWLAKTREFLAKRDLPTDSMALVSELGEQDLGAYDLVVYDLGNFETRERLLPRALDFARPTTGVVLIDDCHRVSYMRVVESELRDRLVAPIPLRELTGDEFGRFCSLATGLARGVRA